MVSIGWVKIQDIFPIKSIPFFWEMSMKYQVNWNNNVSKNQICWRSDVLNTPDSA